MLISSDMKSWILFLLIIGSITPLFSQCPPDSVLLVKYDRDVKDLALKRIRLFNHPDKVKVEIPQIWQDTIWSGLATIFQANNIPERDTVFDVFCIHNLSPMNSALTEDIYIKFDSVWTFDIVTKQIITNNPDLNAFLLQYGLIYQSDFFGTIVRAATQWPLNTQALADSLELFVEINFAEPTPIPGDGDRIYYNRANDLMRFDFQLLWGDCPSGCTSGRTWHFRASDNCTAAYEGRTMQGLGEPFPAPLFCNISSSTIDPVFECQVFPNPFTNNIFLSIQKENTTHYQLFDVSGRIHQNGYFQHATVIHTENLQHGMYFIRMANESFQSVYKLIKRGF